MRVTLPLLRIKPARAPILRYGVAVLSTTLALIPAVLLPNITESRLAVFAVAVMVSAWYGGWKPGLVATSFALTVSAYFSFSGERTPAQFRSTMMRLALFVVLAALICWFNAALRATQEGLRRSEMNFRSLVTNAPYGICRCDSAGQLLDVNPALLTMLGYSSARDLVGTASRRPLPRYLSVVRVSRLPAIGRALQWPDRRMEAERRSGHGGSRFRTRRLLRRQRKPPSSCLPRM